MATILYKNFKSVIYVIICFIFKIKASALHKDIQINNKIN